MDPRVNFLARLALAPDADERAVRRAYARELKLIDQVNDLEGFQYLRDCYEAALRWATARHADTEPATRPPPPAPADAMPAMPDVMADAMPGAAPPAESPADLARDVFADLKPQFPLLAALHGAHDSASGIAACRELLREAFADPRLLPLDTHVHFEREVATWVTVVWRSGHHLLLPAAIDVFRWGEDREALARLGGPGRELIVLLDELAGFQLQDEVLRGRQQDALALLRHVRVFDALTHHDKDAMFEFQLRFPSLCRVLAPPGVVPRWSDDWLQANSGTGFASDVRLHGRTPAPPGLTPFHARVMVFLTVAFTLLGVYIADLINAHRT